MSPPAHDESSKSHLLWGISLGVVSALAYSATNIALRQVSSPDFHWSVWVSCIKAFPAALLGWVLVTNRHFRGLPAFPPKRLVLPLICAGLFMQCLGNVAFQVSLGLGGLALTVPTVFAALITTGSIAGRVVLGEQITTRSVIAMSLLIGSIGVLSVGADQSTGVVAHDSSAGEVAMAMLVAMLSGFTYGITGVIIRKSVTGSMSISATLVLLSTSGFVGLGAISVFNLGVSKLLATSGNQWLWMLIAGVMNAIAFFSVSGALKHIPVTQVNLLNASQAAMCAFAGVMLFDEPVTRWLVIGTAMTIGGLVVLGTRRLPQRSP